MTFYPQFPAFYAYPMAFPSQEFYAVYPPNSVEGSGNNNVNFYEANSNGPPNSHGHHVKFKTDKPGYNNRKESTDSGISDFSSLSSRKTSSTSTISNSSIMEESTLDEVKEEPPFVQPDDETCEQIVQQVEFYFSDANITKDKFLLKHVKRNKEGFVSLKLISSFKRVKHLTKDWRQVAFAIEKKSDKLEVNDVKTKVRRLEALPEYDETTPSRTVVALDVPLERPTIESVAEMFSVCGDIVLVRILRPGNPIPADVRPFVNKHPEMTDKVCALVEFERTEFAHKAVKELTNEAEGKMKVMELTAPPPAKTGKKSEDKKKNSTTKAPLLTGAGQAPARRFSHAGMMMVPQQNVEGPRRKISLFHNMKFAPINEERNMKAGGLNPNAPIFTMQANPHMHSMQPMQGMQGMQRRISKPGGGMQLMPMMEPVLHGFHPQAGHAWMTRRISGSLEMATSGLALPPNVIRMPRGPDKGKGFQRWCKTRMTEEATIKKPASKAVPIVAPPPEISEEKPEEPQGAAAAAADPEAAAQAELAVAQAEAAAAKADDSDEGHYSDPDITLENEKSR